MRAGLSRTQMICNAIDLLKDNSKTWLVVGKGPSSAKAKNFNKDTVNILTLNHACKLVTPTAALFMDFEAFTDCYELLKEKQIKAILPWHPHVKMKPDKQTLEDMVSLSTYSDYVPLLHTFNSTTSPSKPDPRYPVIRVRYFCAVAAINLLVAAGHKDDIYTLGVDGGTQYNPIFADKDRLANGRSSFDVQFEEFEKTKKSSGVRIVKL